MEFWRIKVFELTNVIFQYRVNQFIDKYVKEDIHQQILKWRLLWHWIKTFWIKPNHHHHGIFQTVLWSKWTRNTYGSYGRCNITPFHGICDRWDLTLVGIEIDRKCWWNYEHYENRYKKVSYFITRQIFNILILNLFLLFSVIVHNPYNSIAKQFFTTHSQRVLHTVYDIYNSILWLLSATNLPSTQI